MARTLSTEVRAALDAAVDEIVYAHGAHAGCVDDICAAAGVGKPAFYRHYGSRDEMLVDYLRRRRTQRCAAIVAAGIAAARYDQPRSVRIAGRIAA